MKILLINSIHDHASTGRTCKEIRNYVIAKGNDCIIAYGLYPEKQNECFYFGNRLGQKTHSFLEHLTGLEGYFSSHSTRKLIRFIENYQPDVIHIFNLHSHIIQLQMLFSYLKEQRYPTVLNLDDCWWFSGKCMHFSQHNCEKWKTECEQCPAQHDNPDSWFFDCSNQMQRDKKRIFEDYEFLRVLGVSNWVSNRAKESMILKGKLIFTQYNWINMDVFHPFSKGNTSLQEKYNPFHKHVIACVSSYWDENGFKYQQLNRLISLLQKDEILIVVGKMDHPIEKENVLCLGVIQDLKEIAEIYNFADVYAHLSNVDTFGKVIAEAMSCGTPVVAYDALGIPEVVGNGCGYVIPVGETDQLYLAIRKIYEFGKEYYSTSCVNYVKEHFEMNACLEEILNHYKALVNR